MIHSAWTRPGEVAAESPAAFRELWGQRSCRERCQSGATNHPGPRSRHPHQGVNPRAGSRPRPGTDAVNVCTLDPPTWPQRHLGVSIEATNNYTSPVPHARSFANVTPLPDI